MGVLIRCLLNEGTSRHLIDPRRGARPPGLGGDLLFHWEGLKAHELWNR
jgi:hypothetical protein